MLKKMAFLSMVVCSFVFGDYYTINDARVKGEKTFYFEDGVVLNVNGDDVSLKADGIDLSSIDDMQPPQKFQDTLLQVTQDDKKITKSYMTVNFRYLLTHTPKKDFVLKTPKGKLFIKVESDDEDVRVYGKKLDVTEYEYKVKNAFDTNNKPIKKPFKELMQKYIYSGGQLVAIEILDNGLHKLHKVSSKALQKFLQKKKTLPVEVKKFDFSKDKLYLTYVSKQNNGAKRLEVTYEMSKKNIKTVLKSPISLLDPESHVDSIEQNIGIMRDLGSRGVYEIKKVQLINGHIDVSWLNHPKKRVVVIDYITDGHKDRNLISKKAGEMFYGIEGVFYLPVWMQKHQKDNFVFTFINGSLAFDATMKKEGANKYAMEKKSKVIYSFTLNDRGFVQKMFYPSYDMTLSLESIESDTTRANKAYLKQLQEENKIILIRE